jgi:MYXO-CTERM domain-containing protein
MNRLSRLHSFGATAVVLVASVALPRAAAADVTPPTACELGAFVPGQSCTTAGDGTEDGVCVAETCIVRGNPLYDAATTYPCLLCELVDGGPQTTEAGPAPSDASMPTDATFADAGSAADAASVKTDASTPADAASADSGSGADAASPKTDAAAPSTDAGSGETALASSSSCTVAFAGGTTQWPAWIFGLGAIGLVASVARRRRSR